MRFRVTDIFLPSVEGVLSVSPGEELEGVVVNFSDSGSTSRMFAVVDVIRRQNVVVPVEKLVVVSHSENRS